MGVDGKGGEEGGRGGERDGSSVLVVRGVDARGPWP